MIYFLRRPNGDIKIGTSKRLSARKTEIEKEQGTPVEVIAVMDGSFVEERILHEKFAGYWVGNEWFHPSPPLMDFIQQEAGPWDGTDEAPTEQRALLVVLKGSSAYRDWLNGFAKASRMPLSVLIDVALAKMAKDEGYEAPPER